MKDVQLPQAKIGKGKQLLGGVGLIIGIVIFITGMAGDSLATTRIGTGLTLISLGAYIYGRIENWWYWK